MTSEHSTEAPGYGRAIAASVAAAALGLASGELVAGIVRDWRSPVEAVAESVIDRSPRSVTQFGIDTFGSNDKIALVIGILIVLALAAVAVGAAAKKFRWVGPVAFALVAVVGVAATLDADGFVDAIPSIVAGLVGAVVLDRLLHGGLPAIGDAVPQIDPSDLGRRQFLGASAAVVVVAGAMAAGGRALANRFSAVSSRMNLVLPGAAAPLPEPPADITTGVEGITPFFTPNDTFYRIDTALSVPQVPVEGWTLKVTGMVDEELEFTFDELTSRFEVIETDITLACVSNPIGGELVGTARWLGVRLRDVLDAAGVDPDANQIVGRSEDDYTCGFPVDAAYDREAIIAFGMNGEPLPLEHGFPARLVTPGLYGYISATKWLVEIELTTFDAFDQYWVPRGYADRAPIKTQSRIDVPRVSESVPAGDTVIAGVAWAQTRGIAKVEVQIDDEPFAEATLAEALNDNTWRQWTFPWTATEGNHRVTVRATDGNGDVQTEERTETLPDGASGWPTRFVMVRPA